MAKPHGWRSRRMKNIMKFKDTAGTRFLLVMIALLSIMCVGEGASRLFFFVYWHGHLYSFNSITYALPIGWQLTPGYYRDFHINEQGFRHPKVITLSPEKNTVRIFLVGGSTAFGVNGLYPQVHPPRLSDHETIDYYL